MTEKNKLFYCPSLDKLLLFVSYHHHDGHFKLLLSMCVCLNEGKFRQGSRKRKKEQENKEEGKRMKEKMFVESLSSVLIKYS